MITSTEGPKVKEKSIIIGRVNLKAFIDLSLRRWHAK